MTEGYSGTQLAKKLGLKDGMRVWFEGMPAAVRADIGNADLTLSEQEVPATGTNLAHVFVTDRAQLQQHLQSLRELIDPAGMVWVSWPKNASNMPNDMTEDTIRSVALSMGYVDVKVCAVNEVWSGLKLVIRKELR